MADVHDFQATFNRHQPDVLITMSSKPPAFPEVAYEGEWLFRNFGGYDLLNMDAMGTIANEAIDALQLGKTVLIHCLHGQDRTGIIAAALIYAGYDHPDIDDRLEIIMTKARIKKDGYWFGPNGAMREYDYQRRAKMLALHTKQAPSMRK